MVLKTLRGVLLGEIGAQLPVLSAASRPSQSGMLIPHCLAHIIGSAADSTTNLLTPPASSV